MFAFVVSAVALLSSPPAHPDVQLNALRSTYSAFVRAFERKDWGFVGHNMTATFVERTPSHQVIAKSAFMKGHEAAFKPLSKIKMNAQMMDTKLSGNEGTVECRWDLTAEMRDKSGKHAYRMEGSELHQWLRSRGRWLWAGTNVHDFSVSVDGKVVQHEP